MEGRKEGKGGRQAGRLIKKNPLIWTPEYCQNGLLSSKMHTAPRIRSIPKSS